MRTTRRIKRKTARVITPKLRSLYIAVNPIGSKFAKGLQNTIRNKVQNNVFRVSNQVGVKRVTEGRSVFAITPEALNKVEQLTRFKNADVSTPPFTTNPSEVANLGSKVVFARTLINSTNGRGIVEYTVEDGTTPPRAPLYTAYIPKKAEYRVHVFGDNMVDIQQKRKRRDFQGDREARIRNLKNGYVYCRDEIHPPEGIETLAVNAVKALNYKYGAVDIIYNEKKNQMYVLEVNSRPGLMGTTLEKYGDAIITNFNLRRKV
jgi:hypothetical protein